MGMANRLSEIVDENVLILMSGLDPFNQDVAHTHYTNTKADLMLILKESWVLDPNVIPQLAINYVPFAIIDHDPVSPSMTSRWHTAFRIICPSRFAERQVRQAGLSGAFYIPHGLDWQGTFVPLEGHKRDCKRLWYMKDQDSFVVLIIARNQMRKMIPRQLQGYARFLELNPDIRKSNLILWTDARGSSRVQDQEALMMGVSTQGVDIMPELRLLGLDEPMDRVTIPGVDVISRGVPDWVGPDYLGGYDLVKLYNASEVVLNATAGEGVGMPQIEAAACGVGSITSDWASGPEHVGPGLTVKPEDYLVMGAAGARYALPSVDGIAEALTKIYNTDREKLGRRARVWSKRFDWENVMNNYWAPFLDNCERELRPKVTASGTKRWDE